MTLACYLRRVMACACAGGGRARAAGVPGGEIDSSGWPVAVAGTAALGLCCCCRRGSHSSVGTLLLLPSSGPLRAPTV